MRGVQFLIENPAWYHMDCGECQKWVLEKADDGTPRFKRNPISGGYYKRLRPPQCNLTCDCDEPEGKPSLTPENDTIYKVWCLKEYYDLGGLPGHILEMFAGLDKAQKAHDMVLQVKLLRASLMG